MNGRNEPELPLVKSLTPREHEILICIADGMRNRQIGEHLTIALSTVKWYIRQIYNKLGVNNRGEAIARAKSLGLLPAREQKGTIRYNLPAAVTPFVGRERELASLAELITDPEIHIITLIGPGGIGKTRLALEAARNELRRSTLFLDGIFFISLAALKSTEEIVATLATTLGFHFQRAERGSRSEVQQILDYLGQKQMLLVLDNFELILDGRMLLAEISRRAPKIKILVTSRERLQLRAEQLFRLQGLEIPQIEDCATESLQGYSAAQIFLNIAKRTVPDFELTQGDVKQLINICRLVEGMPLGLELAASWVGLLPLSTITEELEQSLQLLTTSHHDVPKRHRSMPATLDVSWNRLNFDQKKGFQELTVFRAGFTRIAAIEIAGVTLPILVALVNKSWLSYDWEQDRYYVHELLRQYGASELIADSANEQAVKCKHSAYFCSYLKERETDWFGARQQEAVVEIREEIDNIQNAWRWAADRGDVFLLAQSINSLCRFYLWEGRMKDGQYACRSAGEGLAKSLEKQKADHSKRLALWARILAWESEFVKEVTHKEKLLDQSQSILDQVTKMGHDTRAEQAFIYLTKAHAALIMDLDVAISTAKLGLDLCREMGDRWGEAESLQILGVSHYFRGDFELANDLLSTSLDINQELDDMQGIAETILFLGVLAKYRGNFEEAEELHQQSLNLYRQLGNQWGESFCLGILSYTLAWTGKFFAAYESAELAIQIDQDLGQFPIPRRFNPLAKAAIHLGLHDKARTIATESLNIARQSNILPEVGWALMYLGSLAFVERDYVKAKRYLLECEATLAELKHIHLGLPRAILSYVVRAQGDRRLAIDFLERALLSGIEYHTVYSIIYCLPIAALLAADDGRNLRAVELYSLARQFSHITNSRWFEAVACRQLDNVLAALPPVVASVAEAKGRELDLWETADELRFELTTH